MRKYPDMTTEDGRIRTWYMVYLVANGYAAAILMTVLVAIYG